MPYNLFLFDNVEEFNTVEIPKTPLADAVAQLADKNPHFYRSLLGCWLLLGKIWFAPFVWLAGMWVSAWLIAAWSGWTSTWLPPLLGVGAWFLAWKTVPFSKVKCLGDQVDPVLAPSMFTFLEKECGIPDAVRSVQLDLTFLFNFSLLPISKKPFQGGPSFYLYVGAGYLLSLTPEQFRIMLMLELDFLRSNEVGAVARRYFFEWNNSTGIGRSFPWGLGWWYAGFKNWYLLNLSVMMRQAECDARFHSELRTAMQVGLHPYIEALSNAMVCRVWWDSNFTHVSQRLEDAAPELDLVPVFDIIDMSTIPPDQLARSTQIVKTTRFMETIRSYSIEQRLELFRCDLMVNPPSRIMSTVPLMGNGWRTVVDKWYAMTETIRRDMRQQRQERRKCNRARIAELAQSEGELKAQETKEYVELMIEEEHDPAHAIALLHKLREEEPDDVECLLLLADLLAKTGGVDEAAVHWLHVIEIQPSKTEICLRLMTYAYKNANRLEVAALMESRLDAYYAEQDEQYAE